MTGSWLIVKWLVEGAGGACVGALLISWMIEGNEFVFGKHGQRLCFATGIAVFLSTEFASKVCFALAGVVYALIAIALLKGLAKKSKVLLRADG